MLRNNSSTSKHMHRKLGSTALGSLGTAILDGGKAIVSGVQTVANTVIWFAATFAEGLRNVNGHYMIGN